MCFQRIPGRRLVFYSAREISAQKSDSFLDNTLKGMSGSASPHINVGEIKAFKIILPPIAQQKAFSTFVAHGDKSKVTLQKAIDEAQVLFDSLMQQYFG